MFRRLKEVAGRLPSVTSTSVPNKEILSNAGCVVKKGQASLCDEAIKLLIKFQSCNRFSQS